MEQKGATKDGQERIKRSTNQNPIAAAVAVPRVEQFLSSSSASEHASAIDTMSHAQTTVDSKQEDDMTHDSGSVYSYNSTRDVAQFVKEVYGRIFNNMNDAYLLPTDEAEWGRLDKQHSAILIGFGGLYPCPEVVEAVLLPSDTEARRVLDVGCGTGSWAIQMAVRFPHCAVKGIDLAPVPLDTEIFPPNLSFEIDDVNLGLAHFYDQYDLIHARCLKVGLTDVESTIRELERCLKPGGLLIIIDGDAEMEDHNHDKLKMAKLEGDEDVSSVSERGSWYQRMFWEAGEACVLAGSDYRKGAEIIDLGLWDYPLCDPETAIAGALYLPGGPWARYFLAPYAILLRGFPKHYHWANHSSLASDPSQDQALRYAGALMRQVHLNVNRAFHSILRKNGIQQETLDQWSRHIDEELTSMNPRIYTRFHFCWARRRAGEGLPAPPLPPLPAEWRRPESHYPEIEFFHAKEDAAAAREKRRSTLGVWPTSAVMRAQGTPAATV